MFDNLTTLAQHVSSTELDKIFQQEGMHDFDERPNGVQYCKYSNLRLKWYPSGTLSLSNSYHKLHSALFSENPELGNSSDFSHSQFLQVTDHIANLMRRDLKDLKTQGRLEFGVNLHLNDLNLTEYLYSLVSHHSGGHSNPFQMIENSEQKPFGTTCKLSEFNVKFYNKSIEMELKRKNIMRYEVVSKSLQKTRKLLKKEVVTLADLNDKSTWYQLGNSLLNTYDNILKLPVANDAIKRIEMMELFSYVHPTMIKYDKLNLSLNDFNQRRSQLKSKYESHSNSPSSINQSVRKLIKDKVNILIG